MWLDHLTHIIVLILECERQHLLTILALKEVYNIPHKLLLLFKLIRVVVTDDIADLSLLNRALDAYTVEEALVVLGELRTLRRREQAIKLTSDVDGIDHLILGHTRVYVTAGNSDLSSCSVEVLILELTLHTAIHSVCEVGSKPLHVEVVYTTANLLIGGEAHTNFAVSHLRMSHKPLHSCHDLGNTRLVVSTKQRGTICVDECVTLEEGELGELLDLQPHIATEQDIATIIVLNNMWLDISTAHIGSSIYVRDKADNGDILVAFSCRKRSHNIAVLIHSHLLKADGLELLLKVAEEYKLLIGRGVCC